MANYIATARTNYFKVTDEDKYNEWFSKLLAEDIIQDFTETKEDGTILHGFGSYAHIDFTGYHFDDDEEIEKEIDLIPELQELLPDGEAFIYLEAGNEKLRYVLGYALIVTNAEARGVNLNVVAEEVAKELVGEDFNTKLSC